MFKIIPLFFLLAACAVDPAAPPEPTSSPDAGADVCPDLERNPPECTASSVRTSLLVRFWHGAQEIPCTTALASGIRLVVGPEGGDSWSEPEMFTCASELNADVKLRQLTGAFTYDQPAFAPYVVRAIDASGRVLTADSNVRHDVFECNRGTHYQFVSIALPFTHGSPR
jgi:hypothetical protein